MAQTLLILLLLVVYFMPAAIAARRGHNSSVAIFALNLLLGWTALGWIAALVWAFTGNVAVAAARAPARIQCPECREAVLAEARKCKHCGAALAGLLAGTRPCPDCARPAPLAARYCPGCGHNMTPV